ncbi:Capsular polysaccharide synthesis protein [Streptococcus cristatus]|uniref:Capsular polysaccharide synthesis protein n=2 Tax=Streptococcus cristatus TaxID=45634 RepID=A0A3R9SVW6_STRCR|nr:Capsular polysaccharide synthesis protein [Streptococcus cristatus]RSJ82303.1 Capsular polysaccharide synthesis protein [Streptococcus cristatus]RSJ87564.1 Capsular polysaccharide synthesis protein [Streptococcus cristatus]RSJ88030.1 Capsular polysaccharide synthesis protein [Streptococcus cristatus]
MKKKINKKEVLLTSLKNGTFLPLMMGTLFLGQDRKGLELIRLIVRYKLMKKLRKENAPAIKEFLSSQKSFDKKKSNKVWICWMQGLENAPELVQRCVVSIQDNLPDRDIVLITEENYSQYVEFPEHVMNKFAKGIISPTHFSDLLRLELLTRHGGTWIDSTVYCTSPKIPSYMLDSDLFVFQGLKPIDGHVMQISSWFITSETHNELLELTKYLLYKYWEKYDYMKDYFIFHLMFQLAIETYPEKWKEVFPASNTLPHILLLNLFEDFNQTWWDNLLLTTPFHKLTYKFDESETIKDGTYYKKIMKELIK